MGRPLSGAVRVFLIAAATDFLACFVIVINTRAFTKGLYFWTAVTEAFFTTQSFYVGKWMVERKEARGTAAYMGFLIGSTGGALLAIWITKILYGG